MQVWSEKMKNKDINSWIVIRGQPLFSCRTRKQARKFAKENKSKYPQFTYVGKCIKGYNQIVFDV